MLQPEKFIFDLSKPLNFQDTTGDHNTDELLLTTPLGKHEKHVTELQQMLARAINYIQQSQLIRDIKEEGINEQASSEEEITMQDKSDYILGALRASNIDFYEYKRVMYKIFKNETCFIETTQNNIKITNTLLENLSLHDKDRLVGEYSANFILP